MKKVLSVLSLSLLASLAYAQVSVKDAWVRATVAQQKATGAFMMLESKQEAKLVSAQSPVAGVTEVHEMAMDNGVMKMRPIPFLALPAGKAVELKPGGYHVMLMDLKGQVKDGDMVPVILVVEGKDGKRQNIEVKAPVRLMNKPVMGNDLSRTGHSHGEHKH